MGRLRPLAIATLALALTPAAANAALTRAESILPPGQSGFVSIAGVASGTGSPHLYDQLQPYIDFRWKPAGFNQPGATETPKPGVRIVRDGYGVPSITGATEQDMWWGAGYAAAQDRLFELELFRYATLGKLAEVGGKSRLDDDRIVRQDFYTPAELDAQFARVPASLRPRWFAYRDGINAWISQARTHLGVFPGEFLATTISPRPWTVRDSVAIAVYLARTVPTNNDPEGIELANMRLAQVSGARALNALVPLRTKGALATIPRREGLFRSGPRLTRRQQRRALRRSLRLARSLPFPRAAQDFRASGASSSAAEAARAGGSYMFAVRVPGRRAYLFNGPQVGFTAPEKLIEQELHAPGFEVRGLTIPGVPVLGGGYNRHFGWAITTGASDMEDLYAEKLVPGEPEKYVFRGHVRTMDCRTETLRYVDPATTLLNGKPPQRGSVKQRFCRTLHGPVEARAGNIAYARRYALWGREIDSLTGVDALSRATSVRAAGRAARQMTWNENLMAADDAGNIGYWHPGLFPIRPRRFDERLPYPGTGEAEWRGIRSRKRIPSVINPRQRWLANWNNVPSVGWSSGDGTARKRMDGKYFRVNLLFRLVKRLKRQPSFAGAEDVIRVAGTTAQQFAISRRKLGTARSGATGGAAALLDALLGWDGSYHRTGSDGKVDAGVAAWDAFRKAAGRIGTARFGSGVRWAANENVLLGLFPEYHTAAPFHYFDATHLESYGLRTLKAKGYRQAASEAFNALVRRFGSSDPAAWREPRRMFDFEGLAGAQPPPLPFFDRGTYEHLIELGPG